MQKSLSKELFERIFDLSNTLKLETIQLVNRASEPGRPEPCDSSSDTSVILLEPPNDVENNLFVRLLRQKQSSLRESKREIEENCQKSCSKVSLEDLVNLSVFFHLTIEDSIELLCKRLQLDPDQIDRLKSPLSDSIPVSLFQSNLREKTLKTTTGDQETSEIPKSATSGQSEPVNLPAAQTSNGHTTNVSKPPTKSDISEHSTRKLKLEVYNFRGPTGRLRDAHPSDLKNLGLSEETRRLLGLES